MENSRTPQPISNRAETDVQRLMRKHLSDPNHVITDEELANVQVGVSSVNSAPDHAIENRKDETNS